MEGVRVNGLLKCLTQQVLTALRVGHVFEDGEHDIVTHEALSGAEEAEVSHDHAALVGGELVGFP